MILSTVSRQCEWCKRIRTWYEWIKHFQYTMLSGHVRSWKFLASLPTSVPPERLFNSAGEIITDHRTCLLPENAETLIFLKFNCSLIGRNCYKFTVSADKIDWETACWNGHNNIYEVVNFVHWCCIKWQVNVRKISDKPYFSNPVLAGFHSVKSGQVWLWQDLKKTKSGISLVQRWNNSCEWHI